MAHFQEVGVVKSKFKDPADIEEMRESESTVVVDPDYEEGLLGIEENDYLQVLFELHRSEDYRLQHTRRDGKFRGVFASRSPHRPNRIGSTVVELLSREGRNLRVRGLDAIDGTPVLDLKPYADWVDRSGDLLEKRREKPRGEIESLVEEGKLEELLLRAGGLHGHFCPFLSLGVKAGAYGLREGDLVPEGADGMEDLLAIVETNSCFSDGIQYSTGCTLGNNGLIYRDFGKTAVTVLNRGKGSGIRIRVKENENLIEERYPQARELFQKVVVNRTGTDEEREELKDKWTEIAFDLIDSDPEEVFDVRRDVSPSLPDYAPIFEDEYCEKCGEKIMAPKAIHREGGVYCIPCAQADYLQLDGRGLRRIEEGG